MSETVRNEVLSVLRDSNESMDSLQIFNKCQVAERKEISAELKKLQELGILKRDSKKRYSFDVQAEELSGSIVSTGEECSKEVVVMPKPLGNALSELELALKPPANDHTYTTDVKIAALNQLARIMHPEIAHVLSEIRDDVERMSKLG